MLVVIVGIFFFFYFFSVYQWMLFRNVFAASEVQHTLVEQMCVTDGMSYLWEWERKKERIYIPALADYRLYAKTIFKCAKRMFCHWCSQKAVELPPITNSTCHEQRERKKHWTRAKLDTDCGNICDSEVCSLLHQVFFFLFQLINDGSTYRTLLIINVA